jgi:hypothetical protein
VVYQSFMHDSYSKNEVLTMYLMEMSSLYRNITQSQEIKQDQDVCNLCGKVGHKAYACWETQKMNQGIPRIGSKTITKSEAVEVALVSYIDY